MPSTIIYNLLWPILLAFSFACSQEDLAPVSDTISPKSTNARTKVELSTNEASNYESTPIASGEPSESDAMAGQKDESDSHQENLLGQMSIQVGDSEFTTESLVELQLLAEGASEMYVTNTPLCLVGGEWEPIQALKEWTLEQENALATVYVKFKDINGNESECINDSIMHDNLAPSVNIISINDDASHTASTSLQLKVSAQDALEMYITETQDCMAGGTWQPYTSLINWTLAQTNSEATIYIKFKDMNGNESPCTSDSIIHDDFAPAEVGLRINSGEEETNIYQVILNFEALGASDMYVTNLEECNAGGEWEPFINTKVWSIEPLDGLASVYVRYRDEAGNISPCTSAQIGFGQSLSCDSIPGEWVLVPGDADYGTDDFCLMKYEAKEVEDLPRSQRDQEPWVGVSQNEARELCSDLGPGFQLISNGQWMTAASNIAANDENWVNPLDTEAQTAVGIGVLVEGHTDASPDSACQAGQSDFDAYLAPDSCLTSNTGLLDQRRTHLLIHEGTGNIIWDLGGNAHEWVDYYDPNTPIEAEGNEIINIDDSASLLKRWHLIPYHREFWNSNWGSLEGIGRYFAPEPFTGGAMYRGGAWNQNRSSGIFETNLSLGPDDSRDDIGFRCVYSP